MKTCYFCRRVLVHEPFTIATISWATGWEDVLDARGNLTGRREHSIYTEFSHIDCLVEAVRNFRTTERAMGGAA